MARVGKTQKEQTLLLNQRASNAIEEIDFRGHGNVRVSQCRCCKQTPSRFPDITTILPRDTLIEKLSNSG